MKLFSKNKIVVADKLQDIGGAEIVLAQICEAIKPEFIITSTVSKKHDWEKILGVDKIISPSWGVFVRNRHVWFLLYPLICFLMSRIRLNSDDTIFVYSSTASKYVNSNSKEKVVLYSNYPARGIFFPREFFKSLISLYIVYPFVTLFRFFEIKCIKKYKEIYVISKVCRQAYKNKVGVDSDILNCPIDEYYYDFYEKYGLNSYADRALSYKVPTFILVSRLVDWKNLDYVFNYFENQRKLKLVVVGDGPLLEIYRKKYNKNCKFLGYLSANEKMEIMINSCGLVFPSAQEWSLAAIESNSLGLPVVGVRCGGTEETQVIFSKTDVPATCLVYESPQLADLSSAMDEFLRVNWDSAFIHEHSKKFKPAVFREKIINIVGNK